MLRPSSLAGVSRPGGRAISSMPVSSHVVDLGDADETVARNRWRSMTNVVRDQRTAAPRRRAGLQAGRRAAARRTGRRRSGPGCRSCAAGCASARRLREQLVAGLWPRVSFRYLKLSRPCTGGAAGPVPRRVCDVVVELLLEAPPVVQARSARPCRRGARSLLLGLLALGDVARDRDQQPLLQADLGQVHLDREARAVAAPAERLLRRARGTPSPRPARSRGGSRCTPRGWVGRAGRRSCGRSAPGRGSRRGRSAAGLTDSIAPRSSIVIRASPRLSMRARRRSLAIEVDRHVSRLSR